MSCSRVGKERVRLWGGGFRGSSTCPLAADGGEKCRIIYICISFLRAVVVVLVVSVIILIYFVVPLVVIFSLRMYAQQVFSALFTGVLNTIACVCRRGVSGVFPAGLRLAFVCSERDLFGRWKCLPIFYRGLMCMCCACVCTFSSTILLTSLSISRQNKFPPKLTKICTRKWVRGTKKFL